MNITTSLHDEYVVLNIEGSLSVDHRNIFEGNIKKFEDGKRSVILDLSRTTFIDSSSLGLIILHYSNFEKIKKHLILVNINKQIYQMFAITGVTNRINIFDTLQEAIDFIEK